MKKTQNNNALRGLYVTKDGIKVMHGQIWQDTDPRMGDRCCMVKELEGGRARMHRCNRDGSYVSPNHTWVAVRRMHGTIRGWKLIKDVMIPPDEQHNLPVNVTCSRDNTSTRITIGPIAECTVVLPNELLDLESPAATAAAIRERIMLDIDEDVIKPIQQRLEELQALKE